MNKKVFLIFGVVIFLFIIILLALTLGRGNSSDNTESITNTKLQIVEALPAPQENQVFLPVQQFTFHFNEPIDLSGFSYTVIPKTETTIAVDQETNIVTVSPKTAWQTGETVITINSKTKGSNGTALGKKYQYRFTAQFPAPPSDDNEKGPLELRPLNH